MIAEVENFLDDETFTKFRNFASIIDEQIETESVKTNWFNVTNGEFGVETRLQTEGSFKKSCMVLDYHFELDEDLQDEIYKELRSFETTHKDKIDSIGRLMVYDEFNSKIMRTEFQYTDTNKTHQTHTHAEALVGTVYISPDAAKGTTFFEPETVLEWQPNKCVFQGAGVPHTFENDLSSTKRFTLNFFVRKW